MSATWGEGDPRIPPAAVVEHARARAESRMSYSDPATGYPVFTADALRTVGRCCGAGCRHCPYSASEQLAAGRASTRPQGP